jgi:hypothetical protein
VDKLVLTLKKAKNARVPDFYSRQKIPYKSRVLDIV